MNTGRERRGIGLGEGRKAMVERWEEENEKEERRERRGRGE